MKLTCYIFFKKIKHEKIRNKKAYVPSKKNLCTHFMHDE
jgi:hypothetical protein